MVNRFALAVNRSFPFKIGNGASHQSAPALSPLPMGPAGHYTKIETSGSPESRLKHLRFDCLRTVNIRVCRISENRVVAPPNFRAAGVVFS
ncbi:MAG: hypothetical protein OXE41_07895 [Gammaproteobacteria bacterium]|nr:hypothetical protein [Gammaproteobacteria bacterium]MCY4218946.1 hypothetical protein [Gammaproteobacteria bacterium]MCY4275298.1 hypothetical protein [Gammaproteobacteria bacterium]